MKAFKLLPIAAATAALVGMTGQAQAAAYAVSYQNINNLVITSNPVIPLSDFESFSATASTVAELNSLTDSSGGTAGGAVNAAAVDAPGSLGADRSVVDNAYTIFGQMGTSYSNADASIDSTSIVQNANGTITSTGQATQARNIAEANVVGNDSGSSEGSNSSTTGFSTLITLQQATQLTFDFENDPYLAAFRDTVLDTASAEITMSVKVFNAAGAEVFSWEPDGVVNTNILGGTETTDDADLNVELNAVGTGTFFEIDPTGDQSTDQAAAGGVVSFSATTNLLAMGQYQITLEMNENVEVSSFQAVPEPGTVALMGLGVAGLGMFGRKKKAKAS